MKTLTKILGTAAILATLVTSASAATFGAGVTAGYLNNIKTFVATAQYSNVYRGINVGATMATAQYSIYVNRTFNVLKNNKLNINLEAGQEEFAIKKIDPVHKKEYDIYNNYSFTFTLKNGDILVQKQSYVQATLSTNYLITNCETAIKIRAGKKSMYTGLIINYYPEIFKNKFALNAEVGLRKNKEDVPEKRTRTILIGFKYNF